MSRRHAMRMPSLMRLLLATLVTAACLGLAVSASAADAGTGDNGSKGDDGAGWSIMPAGARPTYMGIHGGTMPVSLLVSDDGQALLSFVGRTGNDFLEVLNRTDAQMPNFPNPLTNGTVETSSSIPAPGGTVLMAGSASGSMPVIYLTGGGMQRSTVRPEQLLPFGFSEKPVSIEGQVSRPLFPTQPKHYRLFFQPHYLQPRR